MTEKEGLVPQSTKPLKELHCNKGKKEDASNEPQLVFT
jgi:hypothetical protein